MSTDAMRAALKRMANAADAVGVAHFDSDDLSPEVEELQRSTEEARAALAQPSVRCRAKQVGPDQWVCDCCGPPCTHPEQPSVPAASAGRGPLTESRILDLLSEHTTYDLQAGEEPPLVEDNYGSRRYASRFINFARAIERAHGIGEPR